MEDKLFETDNIDEALVQQEEPITVEEPAEQFEEPIEQFEEPALEQEEQITVSEPMVEESHDYPCEEYIDEPVEEVTIGKTQERKEKITVEPEVIPEEQKEEIHKTKEKKEKPQKSKEPKRGSRSFTDVLRDIKHFFKKVKKFLKSSTGKKVLKIVGIVLLIIAFLLPVGLLAYVISTMISLLA